MRGGFVIKKYSLWIMIGATTLLVLLGGLNLYFVFNHPKTIERLYQLILGGIMVLIPFALVVHFFVLKEKQSNTIPFIVAFCLVIGYLNIQNSGLLTHISTFQTVPSLVGKTVDETKQIIKDYPFKVSIVEDYSETYDKGYVFEQSHASNVLARDVDVLTIYVSIGYNPDRMITLPANFLDLDVDAFLDFVETNRMTNIVVEFEANPDVQRNHMISSSATDRIRRSDELKVVFSHGNEPLGEVPVEDFTKMSLFRATVWLKQNGVPFTIEYEYSDTVPVNQLIRQTPTPGEKVSPANGVTLYFSKGVPIVVPDFMSMTTDQANEWGRQNIINIQLEEVYHDAEIGKIVAQSLPVGEKIDQNTTITLSISKGPLIIPSFSSLTQLNQWAVANGIGVSLSYQNNDSLASGTLISFSPSAGNSIQPGQTIQAVISLGQSISVPNFYGQSRSSIESQCSSLGLSCSFSQGGFSDVPADHAINQSVGAGANVNQGTGVHITLSNGPAKSFTVLMPQSLFTSGTAQGTISALSSYFASNYPGVTFNFQIVQSNSATSGLLAENSPLQHGSVVTQGNSYTVYIYE